MGYFRPQNKRGFAVPIQPVSGAWSMPLAALVCVTFIEAKRRGQESIPAD